MPNKKNGDRYLPSVLAHRFVGFILLAACVFAPKSSAAEEIKIGLLKIVAAAPVYVATEKGYFAAESLTAHIVYFDSGVPIAAGIVAGDIDFGAASLIAAFYNLAGQGAMRIIAGMQREVPTFQGQGYVVSSRAYEAGVKSLKDFAGHSFAVAQMGGPAHYALGRVAEKYHFDLASMRILQTQSLANAVTALVGGQADTSIISMTAAMMPLLDRGEVKLLGWVGDETPWQPGAIITATRTTNERREMVERFLRAYRKGARVYHDAFTGADEKRKDGATAPEILDILAKYTGQSAEQVKFGLTYNDADGRLDVQDVLHQIEWYKSQGMLKAQVDGNALIDKRYVVALPKR